MTQPLWYGRGLLAGRALPEAVFRRARELHEEEDYAASAGLLARHLDGVQPGLDSERGVPAGAAIALQGWNLLFAGEPEALTVLLAGLDEDALERYPELRMIALHDAVQRGAFRQALEEVDRYID